MTEGKRFYAKGGSYSFFAGRDASRSFATGAYLPACLPAFDTLANAMHG